MGIKGFLSLQLMLPLLNKGMAVHITIADQQNNGDNNNHPRFHTKEISFQGSHIQGVALHTTDPNGDRWKITAPLVYALPNQGSTNGLINEQEVYEKIVLFNRGKAIPISEQMHIAQFAGAAAVIIVDFPNTNDDGGGLPFSAVPFLVELSHYHFREDTLLTIPSVIVSRSHYERLKSGMDLIKGDIHEYRDQYVMADSVYADWIPHHQENHYDVLHHDEL